MDLFDLKLFLSVAAIGSFSKAAVLADMTQSAVSKRVLNLELALGQRLFLRHGRGAVLTEAGRLLVSHAEAILLDAQELPQRIQGELAKPQGSVRLAVQASISWSLMRSIVPTLLEQFPQIHLQITEAPTRQIVELIQEGRVDLAVLSEWGHEDLPRPEAVFASALVLLAPPGDPVGAKRNIRFVDVCKLPLILSPMPNGSRVLLEAAAKEAGHSLKVLLEVHSVHLIKKMVQSGWGYSIAVSQHVMDDRAQGLLDVAPISAPALVQNFYLVASNPYKTSSATRTVGDLIRKWGLMEKNTSPPKHSRRTAIEKVSNKTYDSKINSPKGPF